jgi:hypothetical protein
MFFVLLGADVPGLAKIRLRRSTTNQSPNDTHVSQCCALLSLSWRWQNCIISGYLTGKRVPTPRGNWSAASRDSSLVSWSRSCDSDSSEGAIVADRLPDPATSSGDPRRRRKADFGTVVVRDVDRNEEGAGRPTVQPQCGYPSGCGSSKAIWTLASSRSYHRLRMLNVDDQIRLWRSAVA